MDELTGCLGGLFGLAILAAAVGIGGLFLTNHAVLYSEKKVTTSTLGVYFDCTYFTGTQSVSVYSLASTGCARFIEVGK